MDGSMSRVWTAPVFGAAGHGTYSKCGMGIFLIGYRGSGKSTVGRLLAQRLGLKFADSDELIRQKTGRTISEIFHRDGEEAFRELESEILAELAGRADHVISLGGGALVRESNRKVLLGKDHRIFYLSCHAEGLHRRIVADATTADNRPHLTPLAGSVEEIQRVLAQREPIYRSIMSAEVPVADRTPNQVVQSIVQLLQD